MALILDASRIRPPVTTIMLICVDDILSQADVADFRRFVRELAERTGFEPVVEF